MIPFQGSNGFRSGLEVTMTSDRRRDILPRKYEGVRYTIDYGGYLSTRW
jgi:hypothetical protein